MLRIERQAENFVQQRRPRRTTPRPRYYAKSVEEEEQQRPGVKRVDSGVDSGI
jgi:hypothetical protein